MKGFSSLVLLVNVCLLNYLVAISCPQTYQRQMNMEGKPERKPIPKKN